jgi:hypothetical protein
MLANDVGFELLGKGLGKDVRAAIQTALHGGTVFLNASKPLPIFRDALNSSIMDIESDSRGILFQKFLLAGPYDREGDIPQGSKEKFLSDADTLSVITFIYSFMVNCFKGAITELLAAGACVKWLDDLKRSGMLPKGATLYAGDAVSVLRTKGKGVLKGADLIVLVKEKKPGKGQIIRVAGVVEVKSYFQAEERLRRQLDRHITRCSNGLCVSGVKYYADKVEIGYGQSRRVERLTVLPDDWTLPRAFHFEPDAEKRILHVDEGFPVLDHDQIINSGGNEWKITLRWSKEALAAAAYEMTFWYMEKVGEIIYSHNMPKEWAEMSPAEAGRNAAKMMLYYAILRCRNARESQRAVALYNSYGFGYALGMSFVNAAGRREMLWPEDLDEILTSGQTRHGCRIIG